MESNNWHERAAALEIDGRAFINGQRVWAVSEQTFDKHSPIDGRMLAKVARGDVADVDAAVAAARAAFEDRRWAGKSPAARKRTLIKFADLVLKNTAQLALLETLDMGKPIKYSQSVDVPSCANCIRWYGEAIDKIYDEIAPTADNSLALITREPVGVVGAIVPWNYPLIMTAWKIAPALAAGNSVVLKPSEKSPLSALKLAEIALEAGIPAGVFNVVPGYGHEAGAALALHMDVDCIAFTGSTRVGKQIMQMAGQSNLKRAWAELGGKSANIVCADCPDLDKAVSAAIGSIYFNQGESCNAPSRLFVEASIKDEFMAKAMAMMPRFQPGDPLDEATVMGAIVDATQMKSVMGFIEAGKAAGAKLLSGGEAARQESGGFYIAPTLF
ncbi:MAG: aldehyde dehydrogenase family protein, partial [Telluria sp.]